MWYFKLSYRKALVRWPRRRSKPKDASKEKEAPDEPLEALVGADVGGVEV
jgi:hypothetical protein